MLKFIKKIKINSEETKMNTNSKLDFASKYNWWTKDKSNISDETKIGYILTSGKLDELFFVFKNIPYDIVLSAYNSVKNNKFKLKDKRQSVIENYINHKFNI